MEDMKVESNVSVVSKIKVKYPILKKEGYKFTYGTKTDEYIDLFFSKKLDDLTNVVITITEKKVAKRVEGSNYENNHFEAFTWKEIQGINEIIQQFS